MSAFKTTIGLILGAGAEKRAADPPDDPERLAFTANDVHWQDL